MTVNPGESIQVAVDAAAPGDIVLVPAGTYTENVTVDKRITLGGSEGAMVNGKISLTNTATCATVEHLTVNGVAGFSTITVNADDAVVRECTISGGQKGIDLYSAENCTVERCSVGGATDGISLYSMGQSRIQDNQVTGCGCFGIVLRDCPDCIISGNSVQNCNSSGIQLQSGCQGSVVESNTCSHNNNGITVTGCTGTTTVVRDNTIIEDRNIAVNLQSGDSVIVENVTAKDGNYGVSLIDVENITITNSAFTGFSRYGLYVPIGSSAPHSLIANNLFNNSENFYLSSSADLSNIRWNTTKTLGKNIRGGPFLGGNLWLTPEGTGFSETHADFDGDGICDEGYAITDDNGDIVGTDFFPLQNGGPSANFSVTPSGVMVGVPVFFNDTSVGNPTSWSWTFGDETETTQNVTRTYATAGTYLATLTVENEFGTNSTSRTLDVVPYTIQGAVNAASEGDVVLVPSGTYDEDVTVDKRLTLRGSEGAVLNGRITITTGADGATVENFTVNGVVGSTAISVDGAADAVVRGCTIWDGGDGVRITSAPNCTVEGCTLGGTLTGSGIYLSSAGGSQILDNQVTGCGGPAIMFYRDCPNCIISGNSVQDCNGAGIQLQFGCQGSVVESNSLSHNNGGLVIYGCTGAITVLRDNIVQEDGYIAVHLENLDSVIVENVTVKDGGFGFCLFDVENITLTNSIIAGNGGPGLCAGSAFTHSLIANNLFNNTQNLDIRSGTDLTGTRWNTTKTLGKNIRGGPYLGGNYWLTPEGTGFSETHEDLNGDGICDEGYDLGEGCIDHLPLHTCVPTANFTAVPTGGSTPLEVQFAETCSGVNPRLYHWDFGDNTPAVEFVHPSHTFSTNGTHQVTLTVTNAFGSDTATKTVTALEPPTANFTVAPAWGKAPLTVVFTDASTGCVFTRVWDFGDGTTSTEPTPTHVYAKAGTYTVSLNVSNPYASEMMVQERCITVEALGKSGGGNGGRSPGSAGAASHIPAGGHASFEVRGAAITEVEVTAAESVSHILVTVEPTAKPNRIEAPAAAVYEYDEVTLYHTTDEALASADLNFSVPKVWLEEHGVGPESVVLYRYHDDAWHALPTRIAGEDEHCYSFTAESSGFSLFAIGTDESSGPAPTLTPAEPVTALPVTTSTPVATATPAQTPMPWWLAALAAAGACVLLRRR